ncbi:DUF262 domain-containing protein [Leuconostoc citreum]|uniref:DUF262 domain-containing protein n=1 Tax=Leuconostoc citreum TaxID=33964 RepID=UPI0032DE8192
MINPSDFNMSVNNMSIRDFFQGPKKYSIPEFQRPYSWSDVQQNYFLQDIVNSVGKKYFFGTVILVQLDNEDDIEVYSLIDGQQRVTTFVLFMQAIKELVIDARKKIGFDNQATQYDDLLIKDATRDPISGETYQESVLFKKELAPLFSAKITKIGSFSETVVADSLEEKHIIASYKSFLNTLSPDKIINTIRKYAKRSKSKPFETEINNMIQDIEPQDKLKNYVKILNKLTTQLLDQTSLVVITSKNRWLAQTLFKNLNSRGMSLNSVDLIKNDIFEVLNYKNQGGVVEDQWAKILKYTSLSSQESYYMDIATPENFFGVYWNLYHNINMRAAESAQLYEQFSSKIEVSHENYVDILNDLIYTAKTYNFMLTAEKNTPFMNDENYFSKDGHFEMLVYIKSLKEFRQGRSFFLSLIIARQENLLNNKQFLKVLRGTVIILVLFRLGINNMHTSFLNTFARGIMYHVKNNSIQGIREVLNNYRSKLLSYFDESLSSNKFLFKFSEEAFLNNLFKLSYSHGFQLSNSTVKLLLTFCELSLHSSKPGNNKFEKIYSAQVEHIIPLSKGVDNFSNLALISEFEEDVIKDKNIKDENGKTVAADFLEKKEVYKNSDFILLRNLSHLENFEISNLETRNKELGQQLLNYGLKCIKDI